MDIQFLHKDTYNYYGDETCHLANDGNRYMVLGAICCRKSDVKHLSEEIKEIKITNKLGEDFEIKSTKISIGAFNFYEDLIKWFLASPNVILRAIIIDKSIIEWNNANTYNTFYYKMYYNLFRYYMYGEENHIFLDYKDSKSYIRCAEIEDFLSRDHITNMKSITVHQMNSKESELIQMTDLLIGLICYNANEKTSNKAKLNLINIMKRETNLDLFSTTHNSPRSTPKIDILNWRPKK